RSAVGPSVAGGVTASRSRLAVHVLRGLVRAETQELRMAQPAFGGPFYESDLGEELRFDPLEGLHFRGSDPAAPARGVGIRQVGKGAAGRAQGLEIVQQAATQVRDESCAHLSREAQLLAFVGADEQRVDVGRRAQAVAADDEFLGALELQLLPVVWALIGL